MSRIREMLTQIFLQCKREKLTSLGADLVFHGTDCEQTEVAARAMASASETEEYVSPYNDAEIMAGQGTLGLEIMDQLPNIDYLFIAVGGGGLIAGVAACIKNVKPEVVIVGCQPAASPVMYQVWRLSCAKYLLILDLH